MSKVISIVNMKGGVGKTTLAMLLTDYIGCILKKNVCFVDLDAQANGTFAMLGEERFEEAMRMGRTVDHFFLDQGRALSERSLDEYIVDRVSRLAEAENRISLVPSSPRLRLVERNLLGRLAKAGASDQELERRTGAALSAGLAQLTRAGTYVVVDSPPGISGFASAALKASDLVIAPVNLDYLSAIGLELLGREIIGQLKMDTPPPLWACRTRVQANVSYKHRMKFSDPLFQKKANFSLMNCVIRQNADLGRGPEQGEYFQSLKQKYKSAVTDFISFGNEVMSLLEGGK